MNLFANLAQDSILILRCIYWKKYVNVLKLRLNFNYAAADVCVYYEIICEQYTFLWTIWLKSFRTLTELEKMDKFSEQVDTQWRFFSTKRGLKALKNCQNRHFVYFKITISFVVQHWMELTNDPDRGIWSSFNNLKTI